MLICMTWNLATSARQRKCSWWWLLTHQQWWVWEDQGLWRYLPGLWPRIVFTLIIIIVVLVDIITITIMAIVTIAMSNLLWRHPAESGRGSLEGWWSSLCLGKSFINRVGNVELLMISFLGKVCPANWCVGYTSMMWRWLLKIQTQSNMMMLHLLSFKHLSVFFFYLLYIEIFNLKYNIRWPPHIRRRGVGSLGHCWCHD